MIGIIDYGVGNLGSISNMLHRMGVPTVVSSDPAVLDRADKLVLPGVGAFDHGMQQLEDRGLVPVLNGLVMEQRRPILGVCLGMQLLARGSEEGQRPGLGWLAARVVRFRAEVDGGQLKVPHMGWNTVEPVGGADLFKSFPEPPRFYFVHSYHFVPENDGLVAGRTIYGSPFVSAVAQRNVYGVQFHPEKSHKFGMQLLRNFVDL